MNKLILLIGAPASGKTTYANQMLRHEAEILSSDKIRSELLGDEQNQSNNQLVFQTLYSKARDLLKSNHNVVIDATNINKFERQRVLENFKDLNIKRIAICFFTPIEICIMRDKNRKRTVGEDIIEHFFNKYQTPSLDEGFDDIIVIKY